MLPKSICLEQPVPHMSITVLQQPVAVAWRVWPTTASTAPGSACLQQPVLPLGMYVYSNLFSTHGHNSPTTICGCRWASCDTQGGTCLIYSSLFSSYGNMCLWQPVHGLQQPVLHLDV
jgi:hypothetical protein